MDSIDESYSDTGLSTSFSTSVSGGVGAGHVAKGTLSTPCVELTMGEG